MHPRLFHRVAFSLAAALLACSATAATTRLEDLQVQWMTSGWGRTMKNLSITSKPLSLAGKTYAAGVGTHAMSETVLELDGRVQSFAGRVGVDDNAGNKAASIEFIFTGDGRELWRSGVCRLGEAARPFDVKLAGIKQLELLVTDAGDGVSYDHADWVEAVFTHEGAAPAVADPTPPKEGAVILTPAAPITPRIHGPKVYGVRPGSPFLYRIPCTGARPIAFSAENLPAGLTLDGNSGILTGRVSDPGTHDVLLKARNAQGTATRPFRIVAGPQLALTPPMGWNSWYIHYNRVTDRVMRQAADQMIDTGMADYGYQYVNIDDCWMVKVNSDDANIGGPTRDAQGRLLGNKLFPDMKGLTDYIHAKGLKAGTYISPGPSTCAGYVGSYGHEELDARTFAEWGFDFLKYDWCSYSEKAGGNALEHLKKPYQQMWGLLQKQDRDIVFNLCQYGMGDVWRWGGEVGHCWRTTGDLGLERGARLPGFYNIGFSNARHAEFARPGNWNDPDYILIGWVGDAHGMAEGTPTPLTPNEQYSYMSLWCLMAAPLIFSGDMAKLDPFTLNVLCNSEVIDVDQDPLGRQGRMIRQSRDACVMLKELEGGAKALGLFNLGRSPAKIKVTWAELGLQGTLKVRDLWRQSDLGTATDSFEAQVPRHGVALVKLQ
jgi:alpha-galactosidase